jgi:tRNA-2-methylthio-N6-dimethylallyladenosine synthase
MEYKSTVRKLRAIRPELALSSDFIVGFPGETDEDFAKMMKLIEDCRFDSSFSFIFSPRPGTPAAALHDDTPHAVKLARLQQVQAAIDVNVKHFGQALVDTTQRVLVEGASRKNASELMGRTACNRVVNFEGDARLVGQMIDLRITRSLAYTLRGEVPVRDVDTPSVAPATAAIAV